MAWTYSGNPQTSPRDELRFTIGDTTEADPLLSDEEVDFLLDANGGNVRLAAVAACRAGVAKLAREADFSSGVTSLSASQRREGLQTLLEQLRQSAGRRPIFRFGYSEPARFQRGDDKYGRP